MEAAQDRFSWYSVEAYVQQGTSQADDEHETVCVMLSKIGTYPLCYIVCLN